ncbi:MAG: hypothetical protein ABIG70_08075 [Pseudomonadota bacterium]
METIWKLFFLVVLLFTVWGVVLAWRDEAIFFMDRNDLMLSFAGWVSLTAGFLLGLFLNMEWLPYVGAIAALYFIVESVRRAFVHNHNDWKLALPVGVGKVLLSFIYTLYGIDVLSPGGKTVAHRHETRATAMIIIGLLSALFVKLVNGEAVLARRSEHNMSQPE